MVRDKHMEIFVSRSGKSQGILWVGQGILERTSKIGKNEGILILMAAAVFRKKYIICPKGRDILFMEIFRHVSSSLGLF